MELESINIPATNNFASLYIDNKEPVKGFFHYDIAEEAVFESRYNDIMAREYKRAELAQCIEDYMQRFSISEKTNQSLNKLRSESSVVVIGGQQAGLLTGPLYTIHKIISIIKLAEQQEMKLGKPVVPVFWVAGEDHDYLEINHIYAQSMNGMKKISYPAMPDGKLIASHIQFEKEEMHRWINQVFGEFGERRYTNEMLQFLNDAVEKTNTFTDFFTYIIQSLFEDYGLLLIDSADERLRQIEKPFFTQLIDQNVQLAQSVFSMQAEIKDRGFQTAIEIDQQSANLFYYDEQERILLHYDSNQEVFSDKKDTIRFTKEQLFDLLTQYPERFSNNVVTRPLMQEWLFPTLAFIAGPGEIAYWGELKKAFELFDNKMPPIIPRLNMTILDAAIERDTHELGLSVEGVIARGTVEERNQFLASVTDEGLDRLYEDTKAFLTSQYDKITDKIAEIEKGLGSLSQKNLSYHFLQLDYLQQKTLRAIEQKHEHILGKYNKIEQSLRPDGSPQERMWNIFYYVNDRGRQFIDQLMQLEYQFDGTHKLIRL